jgi:hypothetical protein
MIDLMRDTGGMIEQINPMKLPHPVRQHPSTEAHPAPREPVKEKLPPNGKSLKKSARKKK